MTRRDTLVAKYGSEEAYQEKLSEWGKKGAKTKTKEQLSKAGKEGRKVVLQKYSKEQRVEWSKKGGVIGSNKRWVDSLSTPKVKEK